MAAICLREVASWIKQAVRKLQISSFTEGSGLVIQLRFTRVHR